MYISGELAVLKAWICNFTSTYASIHTVISVCGVLECKYVKNENW
jgi:hypothetical protein